MLGTIQMLTASLAALMVSHLHATSAATMASLVGLCGISSLTVFILMNRKKNPAAP
jgi:hypothetical protein